MLCTFQHIHLYSAPAQTSAVWIALSMLSWFHIAPPKPLCSWVVKCMQISCCFILQLKCCTAEQQKVFWKFSGEKLAILQCSLAHISAAKQVLCCCVTSCCVKTQEKLCCRAEREKLVLQQPLTAMQFIISQFSHTTSLLLLLPCAYLTADGQKSATHRTATVPL